MGNKNRKARKRLQNNLRAFGQTEAAEQLRPTKPEKQPTGHYRTKSEERLAKRRFRTTLDTMIRNAAAKLREEGL